MRLGIYLRVLKLSQRTVWKEEARVLIEEQAENLEL